MISMVSGAFIQKATHTHRGIAESKNDLTRKPIFELARMAETKNELARKS